MLGIMETISGKHSLSSNIGRTSRGDDLFGSFLIAASTSSSVAVLSSASVLSLTHGGGEATGANGHDDSVLLIESLMCCSLLPCYQ